MPGICFQYDEKNRAEWDDLARAYKVQAYEINTPNTETVGRFKIIKDLSDITIPIVAVQPVSSPTFPGEISLLDFEHPSDVVYLFGADHVHNEKVDVLASVYIPMPNNKCIWSVQAAAIVLYDRYAKWQTK